MNLATRYETDGARAAHERWTHARTQVVNVARAFARAQGEGRPNTFEELVAVLRAEELAKADLQAALRAVAAD